MNQLSRIVIQLKQRKLERTYDHYCMECKRTSKPINSIGSIYMLILIFISMSVGFFLGRNVFVSIIVLGILFSIMKIREKNACAKCASYEIKPVLEDEEVNEIKRRTKSLQNKKEVS